MPEESNTSFFTDESGNPDVGNAEESRQKVEETEIGSGDAGKASSDTGSHETDERLDEGKIGGDEGDTQEKKEEQEEEPLVDIGGSTVPLSQVRKAIQDQARIQAREQELEARGRRVAHLEYIEPMLQQRQDLVQQLFAPKPERDYNKELSDLYGRMPDPYDREAMAQWSLERDTLIAQKSTADMKAAAATETMQRDAIEHNNKIESAAREKYVKSGLVTEYEFNNMGNWIAQNVQIRGGKAPEQSFDVAFQVLHREKFEEQIALKAAKKALGPLGGKKTPVSGEDSGITRRSPIKTDSEALEDEFIQRMNSRKGH